MKLAELAVLLTGTIDTIAAVIKADPDAAEREVRREVADYVRGVEIVVRGEADRVSNMSRSELDDLLADLLTGDD